MLGGDSEALEILPLEDNPADSAWVGEMLRRAGTLCRFRRLWSRLDYARALVRKKFDLITSDVMLQSLTGSEAPVITREKASGTPLAFSHDCVSMGLDSNVCSKMRQMMYQESNFQDLSP